MYPVEPVPRTWPSGSLGGTSPPRWPRCDARRGSRTEHWYSPFRDLRPKLLVVSERDGLSASSHHMHMHSMLALTICPLRLPQGRQSHRSVVRLSHESRAPLRDVAQRAAVLSLPRRALCAAAGLALAAGPASQATASQAVGSVVQHGQSSHRAAPSAHGAETGSHVGSPWRQRRPGAYLMPVGSLAEATDSPPRRPPRWSSARSRRGRARDQRTCWSGRQPEPEPEPKPKPKPEPEPEPGLEVGEQQRYFLVQRRRYCMCVLYSRTVRMLLPGTWRR